MRRKPLLRFTSIVIAAILLLQSMITVAAAESPGGGVGKTSSWNWPIIAIVLAVVVLVILLAWDYVPTKGSSERRKKAVNEHLRGLSRDTYQSSGRESRVSNTRKSSDAYEFDIESDPPRREKPRFDSQATPASSGETESPLPVHNATRVERNSRTISSYPEHGSYSKDASSQAVSGSPRVAETPSIVTRQLTQLMTEVAELRAEYERLRSGQEDLHAVIKRLVGDIREHIQDEDTARAQDEEERRILSTDQYIRGFQETVGGAEDVSRAETGIKAGLSSVKSSPELQAHLRKVVERTKTSIQELRGLQSIIEAEPTLGKLAGNVLEALSNIERNATNLGGAEAIVTVPFTVNPSGDGYLTKGYLRGVSQATEMTSRPESFFEEELDRVVKQRLLPLLDACYRTKTNPQSAETIRRVAAGFGLDDVSPKPGGTLDPVNHKLLQFEPGPRDKILEVSIRGYSYKGKILRKPVVIAGQG